MRLEPVSKKLPLKSIPGITGIGRQGKIAHQTKIPSPASTQTTYNSAAKAADKAPSKLNDAAISARWTAEQTRRKVSVAQQKMMTPVGKSDPVADAAASAAWAKRQKSRAAGAANTVDDITRKVKGANVEDLTRKATEVLDGITNTVSANSTKKAAKDAGKEFVRGAGGLVKDAVKGNKGKIGAGVVGTAALGGGYAAWKHKHDDKQHRQLLRAVRRKKPKA